MTLKDIVCRTHPSNLITVINYLTDEVLIETDTTDHDAIIEAICECGGYDLF